MEKEGFLVLELASYILNSFFLLQCILFLVYVRKTIMEILQKNNINEKLTRWKINPICELGKISNTHSSNSHFLRIE